MSETSSHRSGAQRAGGRCESGASADGEWIRELCPESESD